MQLVCATCAPRNWYLVCEYNNDKYNDGTCCSSTVCLWLLVQCVTYDRSSGGGNGVGGSHRVVSGDGELQFVTGLHSHTRCWCNPFDHHLHIKL